ncbi:hypothetical protein J437_LFUL010263 [Ladona fulva]|uniref:THAP-type domain-containing protein n=1 Tax=Ladona fulva TaxID=123851 RepID=A0A8K0KGQ3_LADFU|nr:hypothetical protein J437_LFUL010263 [Ladona fulva]
MPTICCAVGCKHSSGNGVCRLKRFPSDAKRSIVWEKNLRRNHWIRKDWELLCECHFHFSQFEKVREDGAKKLRHNAVPTLFPTHTIPLVRMSDLLINYLSLFCLSNHSFNFSRRSVRIINPSTEVLETLVPLETSIKSSVIFNEPFNCTHVRCTTWGQSDE